MLTITYVRGDGPAQSEAVEARSLRSWLREHADCVVLRSVPVRWAR